MNKTDMEEIYDLLNKIKVTRENKEQVEEIRQCLIDRDFETALTKMKEIRKLKRKM